jgi:hypothetical protein
VCHAGYGPACAARASEPERRCWPAPVQPAGRPGGPLQLHLSVVPLRGPIKLRLGLRLALDSRDVLGTGLLLGLVGGDALRGLVRTGLEFAEERATARLASMPWVRRNAKSASCAPPAASTQRAALVATAVWNVTWLSSTVSASCASATGAVTSSRGSPAKTTCPSGTARTSPVNRSPANARRVSSPYPWAWRR